MTSAACDLSIVEEQRRGCNREIAQAMATHHWEVGLT
jgi:hypothetical protein